MYGRDSSPFFFDDRTEAGSRLAHFLSGDATRDALVVGLAPGGVVVAAEIAETLELPLEAIAVTTVPHPWQTERAIGAVTGDGDIVVTDAPPEVTDQELAAALASAGAIARTIERILHADRVVVEVAGRSVLLVDDGLASSARMLAAARWARRSGAGRIVATAPVGAAAEIDMLAGETDRVVCPYALPDLIAVGIWYADFAPVSAQRAADLLVQRGPATRAVPAPA